MWREVKQSSIADASPENFKVRHAVGGTAEQMQFSCEACEYTYELDQQLTKPARLDRKVIDDIISLEDVMKNAPQTKGAPRLPDLGEDCSPPLLLPFAAV